MFVVSSAEAAKYLAPLAAACERRGLHWGCFFTNDGVRVAADDRLKALLPRAGAAVACSESWRRFMGEAACPVELGSQTEHSALAAQAERIVSL